jgi:hypothetical protein
MTLLLWLAMGVPADDVHVLTHTCLPGDAAPALRGEFTIAPPVTEERELFVVGRGWKRATVRVTNGAVHVEDVPPCVDDETRVVLALHSSCGVASVVERALDHRAEERLLAFIQRERGVQLFADNEVRSVVVRGPGHAIEIVWVVSWMEDLAMSIGIVTDERERHIAIDGLVDVIGAVELDTGNIALVLQYGEAIAMQELVDGKLMLRRIY